MSRYSTRDRESSDHLTPQEAFVQHTLEDYRYTDHPHIWTPTRALYVRYAEVWNERAGGKYGTHHIEEYGRPLTPGQFGRALGQVFPDHERLNLSIRGKRWRGIGGLCGPGSFARAGWEDYPAGLCDFPPPSGWTPAESVGMLPTIIGPE